MAKTATKRKSSSGTAKSRKRKASTEAEAEPYSPASEEEEKAREDAEGDQQQEEGDQEKELYCVCRKPYDGSFMICCDACDKWFHPQCVHISQRDAKRIKEYYCPSCRPKADVKAADSETPANEDAPVAAATTATATTTPKREAKESSSRDLTREQIAEALGGGERAEEVAAATEAALFARRGTGVAYAQAARRVVFNLKDAKNEGLRKRVLDGSLPPEELATATPEQLANSEIAEQRRLREQRRSAVALSDELPEASEKRKSMEKIAAIMEQNAAPSEPTTLATPAAVPPPAKRAKITAAYAFSRCAAAPDWEGVVEKSEKSGFGPFGVAGYRISGDARAHGLMPRSVEVAGRLEMDKLLNYLQQLSTSNSRRREVLRLVPSSEADCEQYAAIHAYFTERDRAGFVKPVQGVTAAFSQPPEELYMVPLTRSAPLPEFLARDASFSQAALDQGLADDRVLMLVLVAKNTTLDTSPAKSAELPVAPSATLPVPTPAVPTPAPAASTVPTAPKDVSLATQHAQDVPHAIPQAQTDAQGIQDGDRKETKEPEAMDVVASAHPGSAVTDAVPAKSAVSFSEAPQQSRQVTSP